MRKNIIISIIMIIIILTNTVSYAATELPIETLEESVRTIFSKNIEINGVFENGTSTSTIEATQVEVGDNKILITEEGAENFTPISYSIEENICQFEHKYKVNISEDSTAEEAFKEAMMILLQQKMISNCYLATADAIGKDLSLAYTYYSQKSSTNNDDTTESESSIVDDVFTMKVVVSEDETEYMTSLEINLEKMAELDESDLDSSAKYTVTLVEPIEEEENKEQIGDEIEKQPEEEANEKQTGEETENQPEKEETVVVVPDDSLAKKEIPKAGNKTITCIVGIVMILTIMLYVKYKKYEDIK